MPVDMLNPVQARDLRVRMAKGEADLRAAQHLRWKVFCEELGATVASGAGELDVDPFDPACDHLLVEDMTSGTAVTVGTYRLLRHGVARTIGGFYSAGEFDLEPLLASADARTGELLELGRSCVLPAYRNSGTIQLLWRGIAHYLQQHRIAAMFGCASFSGTDPDAHAEALSYLHFNHLAPRETRVVALPEQFVDMARLPIGSFNPQVAARLLPPLIKGYLRLGATVGHGAVIDHDFNTTDVFVMLPVDAISSRYLERLGKAA
jgi:putative hemolysin